MKRVVKSSSDERRRLVNDALPNTSKRYSRLKSIASMPMPLPQYSARTQTRNLSQQSVESKQGT